MIKYQDKLKPNLLSIKWSEALSFEGAGELPLGGISGSIFQLYKLPKLPTSFDSKVTKVFPSSNSNNDEYNVLVADVFTKSNFKTR